MGAAALCELRGDLVVFQGPVSVFLDLGLGEVDVGRSVGVDVGVTHAHDALRAAGHAALGREAIAGQADLLDVQLGALGGRAQTHA